MTESSTRPDMKTRFGRMSDYDSAAHLFEDDDVGELYDDLVNETGDIYGVGQDIARSFYEEDHERFNKRQLLIRDVAKKRVRKENQPEWAWHLLSTYDEDLGTRLLEVPSEGQHKGLIVSEPEAEGTQKCFLYSKDHNGISDVKHIERYALNLDNLSSIGIKTPSDYERVCLELETDRYYEGPRYQRIAALEMNFNQKMITTDNKLTDYLRPRVKKPENLADELRSRFETELNKSYSNQKLVEWAPSLFVKGNFMFDLSDLVDAGMFMNQGFDEFLGKTGNTALEFPDGWEENWDENSSVEELWEKVERIVVDAGEYPHQINSKSENDKAKRKALEEDPFLTPDEKENLLV